MFRVARIKGLHEGRQAVLRRCAGVQKGRSRGCRFGQDDHRVFPTFIEFGTTVDDLVDCRIQGLLLRPFEHADIDLFSELWCCKRFGQIAVGTRVVYGDHILRRILPEIMITGAGRPPSACRCLTKSTPDSRGSILSTSMRSTLFDASVARASSDAPASNTSCPQRCRTLEMGSPTVSSTRRIFITSLGCGERRDLSEKSWHFDLELLEDWSCCPEVIGSRQVFPAMHLIHCRMSPQETDQIVQGMAGLPLSWAARPDLRRQRLAQMQAQGTVRRRRSERPGAKGF